MPIPEHWRQRPDDELEGATTEMPRGPARPAAWIAHTSHAEWEAQRQLDDLEDERIERQEGDRETP